MAVAYRNKQRIVSVSVSDGATTRNYVARTKTGGGITGNAEKAFLGGMTPQVSLGGDPEREDVTLTVAYTDSVRDQLVWLNGLVGNGNVTITEKLNGVGAAATYTGKLDALNTPDYDAADNSLQEIELVVSMDANMK